MKRKPLEIATHIPAYIKLTKKEAKATLMKKGSSLPDDTGMSGSPFSPAIIANQPSGSDNPSDTNTRLKNNISFDCIGI